MTWPGKAADDWWDSLPVTRREQIHGWVEKARTRGLEVPDEQMALEVPELVEGGTQPAGRT